MRCGRWNIYSVLLPERFSGFAAALHLRYSFLSFYQEIGDCLFAQVVRIRDKKAHGKSLDKQDREFYRKNRDIIDLKTTYTESEKDVLAAWGISK